MMDFIYVVATIAFFVLMLAYVAGCAALGRGATEEATSGEARQ